MKTLPELSRSENLKRILDDNTCPVARMRLFSTGVQTNNRIYQYEPITGDKGCLACGNCIDACPVVREKQRFVFVQNQRTSMNLENVVGPECRRCYACVRACPQVSKATKEFATGYRRREKFIHAYTATLVFALAASGIFLFHYKELLPGWQQFLFKAAHAFAGFALLLAPVLFVLLDRAHLLRALRNVSRFGNEDLLWLRNFWAFLKSPRRKPLPSWKEFNTYHKFWYAYLLSIVPLLGITGIINLLGAASVGPLVAGMAYWVHSLLAMLTDALVITHLYFKLLRHMVRNVADMGASFQQSGHFHYPFLYDSKSR